MYVDESLLLHKSLVCRLELLNISHLWSDGGLNVLGLFRLRSLRECVMHTVEYCTFIKPVLIARIPRMYSVRIQGFGFTLFVVFRWEKKLRIVLDQVGVGHGVIA